MATLTSFFLSESGFASPSKVLSGSWITGLMICAASLLFSVNTVYAQNCVKAKPCGGHKKVKCCCKNGDPELQCFENSYSCSCS